MKLTPEEMQQIIQEVEDAKVRALRRLLEDEAEMEFRHGDWGCRD